jgi:hypothetical protein
MSRANIISIVSLSAGLEAAGEIAGALGQAEIAVPFEGAALAADELTGIIVTFSVHEGGTRSYKYYGSDAEAIENGADPAGFLGEPA